MCEKQEQHQQEEEELTVEVPVKVLDAAGCRLSYFERVSHHSSSCKDDQEAYMKTEGELNQFGLHRYTSYDSFRTSRARYFRNILSKNTYNRMTNMPRIIGKFGRK